MSDVSDAARVQVLLADYANVDGSGKINALGMGFTYALPQPTGVTPPHTVVVNVELPSSFTGSDMAFELTLFDDSDSIVETVSGPFGQGTAVRLAQNIVLDDPLHNLNLPDHRVPREAMVCQQQIVANMQNGVPVRAGRAYEWRVSIDTVTRPDWLARFYVPEPRGGLVVG